MSYITAVLLMYMEKEEDAFWTAASILTKYEHKKYFMPGMPGLFQSFYVFDKLLKDQLPKVHAHFDNLNLSPEMYASQWFMTIFTIGVNYESTVRIYDAFMTEGPKILYRVGLYIMKANEVFILRGGMEELFAIIKIFLKDVDEDELVTKS